MATSARSGVIIFSGDKERLSRFYKAMTDLPVQVEHPGITVLASDEFELVIHALQGEPAGQARAPREDVYIKPFFPVASLGEARERAVILGGQLRPQNEEWAARGFRACEATDPDGNVIQFREDAP
jgi:predicted enzyme related to lactoylglutathione lyase